MLGRIGVATLVNCSKCVVKPWQGGIQGHHLEQRDGHETQKSGGPPEEEYMINEDWMFEAWHTLSMHCCESDPWSEVVCVKLPRWLSL